jgi:uncharacterized protein (DUF983 family)
VRDSSGSPERSEDYSEWPDPRLSGGHAQKNAIPPKGDICRQMPAGSILPLSVKMMMMIRKGQKLYSIFKMKCPNCHEGDLFVTPNPYKLSEMAKMHRKCSHCDLNYHPEPSFYYGSMYVSYGYSVAMFVAVFVLGKYVFGLGIPGIVATLAIVLVVLGPYLFRLSRATWINLFVRYQGKGGIGKS